MWERASFYEETASVEELKVEKLDNLAIWCGILERLILFSRHGRKVRHRSVVGRRIEFMTWFFEKGNLENKVKTER